MLLDTRCRMPNAGNFATSKDRKTKLMYEVPLFEERGTIACDGGEFFDMSQILKLQSVGGKIN